MRNKFINLLLLTSIFLLNGCGGGGGGGGNAGNQVSPTLTVTGVAATGKAIAAATVGAKCQSGTGTAITTSAGEYSLSINSGLLPCILQITDPTDGTVIHSLATGTSNSTVANITPLTQLLTARLLRQDPAAYYSSFNPTTVATTITSSAVLAAQNDVVSAFAGTLDTTSVSNLISTPMIAATAANPTGGDIQDKLLDTLRTKLTPTKIAQISTALAGTASTDSVKSAIISIASNSGSGSINALFTLMPNTFPDLTYAYRFFDANSTKFGQLAQAFTLNPSNNGTTIFGMAMVKGTDNFGVKVTEPCKSKVFLYKMNSNGNFEDVTDQLIQGSNDLGGCIRKTKKFDINSDGISDIVFAVNQEDGRSADLGSTFTAQMAALVSLPNSKYTIQKFGNLNWYHSVGAGIGADGQPFVTGAGFSGTSNIGYSFSGTVSSVKTSNLPAISPNTFEFIAVGGSSTTDYLVQTGTYPNLFSVDGYKLQSDGSWQYMNSISSPFPVVAQENFITYSSDTATVPVADMNGTKVVLAGGFAITESCKIKPSPSAQTIVIMKMELPTVPNYVAGQTIRQQDLVVGNKLIGVQVINNRIQSFPLNITDELIFDGLNGYINFDCIDFDGDGYQDIVVYRMAKGKGGNQQELTDASPLIYINQKDGTFRRVASNVMPAMLPQHYTDQVSTIVGDFNGDGVNDVVLFPSSPGSSVSGDVKYFKGNR